MAINEAKIRAIADQEIERYLQTKSTAAGPSSFLSSLLPKARTNSAAAPTKPAVGTAPSFFSFLSPKASANSVPASTKPSFFSFLSPKPAAELGPVPPTATEAAAGAEAMAALAAAKQQGNRQRANMMRRLQAEAGSTAETTTAALTSTKQQQANMIGRVQANGGSTGSLTAPVATSAAEHKSNTCKPENIQSYIKSIPTVNLERILNSRPNHSHVHTTPHTTWVNPNPWISPGHGGRKLKKQHSRKAITRRSKQRKQGKTRRHR